MSILQIGLQSRHLQASPGCRKYINPFLSNQERHKIQIYRQENQAKYREVLLDQIRQKQREKQMIRKKQAEEDLKHERDFYQKIKKYQSRDANSRSRKHRVVGNSMPRVGQQDDYPMYNSNIFRKPTAEPSFPPLHSSLLFPQQNNFHYMDKSSIFLPKNNDTEGNYLKYNSLMEIGKKIRKQKNMGRSVTLENEEYGFEDRRREKFQRQVEKEFYQPEKGYKELKIHLKQKENQVYDLIEKSTELSKSTKSPIREIKKRLKTHQVYIPSDNQEQEETYHRPLRYRIRTQFGTRHGQDYDDIFYRLPSLPSLDWTSSETNTLGYQSTIVPSQRTNQGMIKIDENPENQFMQEGGEEKKISDRMNNGGETDGIQQE